MTEQATRTIGAQRDGGALQVAARDDSEEALEVLLHRVRPKVFRTAWVYTLDSDDAEDITQAVLMKVTAHIGDFEGRSSLETWLFRVTSNMCVEHHRKRSAWKRLRDRWTASSPARSAAPDPLKGLRTERTLAVVKRAMLSLSPNQRMAVDMVDLQGLDPGEAAALLEMNAATFRTHLSRARKALRGARIMERE
jgi:RNA polymerase sigma-70 factor (ECF subfamily)